MSLDNTVEIIPFSATLAAPIKTLNLEWLKKYFKVEPKDEIVLSDPQGQIIDKGGMIFYAKYNDFDFPDFADVPESLMQHISKW